MAVEDEVVEVVAEAEVADAVVADKEDEAVVVSVDAVRSEEGNTDPVVLIMAVAVVITKVVPKVVVNPPPTTPARECLRSNENIPATLALGNSRK